MAPPAESVSLATSDSGVHPWWEIYQPVSYNLTSRFGTRAEFSSMVTACHNAGVRVYVDAVVNHMAGANNTLTTTYGGSTFNPSGHAYPAVPYVYDDFHHANDGYWTTTSGNVIGFSRGSLGWFGLNNSSSASTAGYPTGLADGVYCDRITGGASGTGCNGTAITVAGGTASVTIPANSAVAIDVNATSGGGTTSPTASPSASATSASPSPSVTSSPTPSPSVTTSAGTVAATFNVYATTTTGTDVYVVGSNAALGSWSTANAVKLSAAGYPIWTSTVPIPSGTGFEYKYIKKDASGNVTWESGGNRSYTTGTASAYTVSDTWK
ncbi:hypothetical protein FHR83_002812 [Actinoplanes campanulatus]|uniref:Alpha-amylase n=1 Tax=Actinoplanes campanulatus TaxID=113559 RepID=A0A7W5AFP8_9ACTN|nr:carbohydrate-binding module family 20 domain-containing protein [Actinoplanes campanulatus]MBB3095149.1 hypothetical protein [Actinoplanes campanulatus]GGN23788.1 hypothetical protein GCM10010109_38940 [Actinoplanes campanulatus]GID34753.1 hypothetical protein Aca09nite_12590 [Actinoplanes campanulatus]